MSDNSVEQNKGHELLGKLTPQKRAQLLYEYCLASEKKVSETVHSLYIIAEHYGASNPTELLEPQSINGIPSFFKMLTPDEKAEYCYNQVTEALSIEASPVTVESLRATKRSDPDDPWSSYAGSFVWKVTWYVVWSLVVILGIYLLGSYLSQDGFIDISFINAGDDPKVATTIQWIAFGCIGALIHLLNHALTTTRLQTFELSEARKIGPRLLLGGMLGFVVPWLLWLAGPRDGSIITAGPIIAFFGGYSVRFSTGLIERLMAALLPETKPRT